MTDLIPKPRRRMKQPTKDALRQKIKDQAEELERLREENLNAQATRSGALAMMRACGLPPYRWWRQLLGLRCQPKDHA